MPVVDLLRRVLASMLAPVPITRSRRSPIYLAVLLVGLAVIPLWQKRFLDPQLAIGAHYANTAATGVHAEPRFLFFLRHLGLFPLVTDAPIREDTKAEATRLLREEGASLKVDHQGTFRSGDRGRVWLYFPHAWIEHDSLNPKLGWGNALGFWFALEMLWVAFWWIRKPAFGAASVVLLGSNPFMLYSTYRQENVLGWPITCAIVLLAIHLPLMVDRLPRARWTWAIPIVAAVWLGTMRTVRSEPMLMAGSALLVYLTMANTTWHRRLSHAFVFVAAVTCVSAGYSAWFKHKFNEAHSTMVAHGGSPYTGPVELYHEVWHPIFCGLGDFDTTKGYQWNDNVAYDYVRPVLLQKYGVKMLESKPGDWGRSHEFWDERGKYPKYVHEVAHYHDVVRDKVISDIRSDPRWYLDILDKRVWRILKETTPLSVHLGKDEPWSETSTFIGPLCVALAALLAITRRWSMLKLLLFMTPLSAPALIVFSGKGMQYIGCYHVFGAVIFGAMLVEGARRWLLRPMTA